MIRPYIMFNGNCEEALNFYAGAFGGQIKGLRRFGSIPASPDFPIPPEIRDNILHAELHFRGGFIMCSDGGENEGAFCDGVRISVEFESEGPEQAEAEAKQAWGALLGGGKEVMPLQPTFFARLHGTLRDKYGVYWMFTVDK